MSWIKGAQGLVYINMEHIVSIESKSDRIEAQLVNGHTALDPKMPLDDRQTYGLVTD